MKEKIEKVRIHVSLNETDMALNELKRISIKNSSNAALLLEAQYRKIKESLRLNIISFQEAGIELSKVNYAILDICNDIEKADLTHFEIDIPKINLWISANASNSTPRKGKPIDLLLALFLIIGWFLPFYTRETGDVVSYFKILYETAFGTNGGIHSFTDFIIDFFGFLFPSLAVICVPILYVFYFFYNRDELRIWAYRAYLTSIIFVLTLDVMLFIVEGIKIGVFLIIYQVLYLFFGLAVLRNKKIKPFQINPITPIANIPTPTSSNEGSVLENDEIVKWLKENPGKGINDYYAQFRVR